MYHCLLAASLSHLPHCLGIVFSDLFGCCRSGAQFPGKTLLREANAWERQKQLESFFSSMLARNPRLSAHPDLLRFMLQSDVSIEENTSAMKVSTKESLGLQDSLKVNTMIVQYSAVTGSTVTYTIIFALFCIATLPVPCF